LTIKRKQLQKYILLLFLFISLLAHTQLPRRGLIAYYPFDNTSAADKSGNGNNGNIIGNVKHGYDRFGNSCGALDFDGATGYINVPNTSSIQSPESEFSVSAWIKMKPGKTPNIKWITLICKGIEPKETDNNPQYRIQALEGPQSTVSINTDFTEYWTQSLSFDIWYFYTQVYDGNEVAVYLDGQKVWNFAYNKRLTPNNAPLEIGRDIPGSTEFFCGSMDELRIFNKGLTPNEVAALYNDQTGSVFSNRFDITTLQNIVVKTEPGKCFAKVSYTEPRAISDCGTANVQKVAGPTSGSSFQVGRTPLSFLATNDVGEQIISTYYVEVQDAEPPLLACPNDIVVKCSNTENSKKVDYNLPAATDNCGNAKVEMLTGLASGSNFPLGITNIKLKATDASGNATECFFKVIVEKEKAAVAQVTPPPPAPPIEEKPKPTPPPPPPVVDNTPPSITCPKDITADCESGKSFAKVDYVHPVAIKAGKTVQVKLIAGYESGSNFPVGSTIVKFEATDELDNKNECFFKVTVLCATDEFRLKCPDDIRKNNDAGKCGAVVTYTAPEIIGTAGATIAQTDGEKSGSMFKVGTSDNTFKASHNGVSKSCSFTVKVSDNEEPNISCPDDKVIYVEADADGIVVNYDKPTATDNCEVEEMKLLDGLGSGSFFPVGINTETYKATDKAGNTRRCSFDVVVKQKPSKTVQKVPLVIDHKLNIGSDSVITQQQPIVLSTCNITLCIYDDAQEDGDIVSVVVNDKVILDKAPLQVLKNNNLKEAYRIPVLLKPNEVNYIISKAWNVGSISPNTLKIDVYEGEIKDEKMLRSMKPIQSRKMSSKPGLAGAILIQCKN
jgi:hypothetical protein